MATAASALPASPGLSQIERVVDTFVAPSKTFSDILRSASVWLPMLLIVASFLASAFVIDKKVGFDQVYANTLHQSPAQEERLNGLEPEAKAKAMQTGANVTRGVTYGLSVGILVIQLIYALILWGLFNFALGADTKFPQVFAVSIYALLPYLVTTLITVAVLYFGGSAESFDQRNPIGTNLAYYLPELAPWLKALLTQLDVVRLWSLVLAILGMAIISKKSIASSAAIVGGLWMLGVLVGVASAAAFS